MVLTNQFVSAFNGETNARVNALTIISNLNAIYKKELAIQFIVDFKIESNAIYNIDITPTNIAIEAGKAVSLYFSQTNYDLGHIFHLGGIHDPGKYVFKGKAGLGVVCNNQGTPIAKATGWTQMNPFILNVFT